MWSAFLEVVKQEFRDCFERCFHDKRIWPLTLLKKKHEVKENDKRITTTATITVNENGYCTDSAVVHEVFEESSGAPTKGRRQPCEAGSFNIPPNIIQNFQSLSVQKTFYTIPNEEAPIESLKVDDKEIGMVEERLNKDDATERERAGDEGNKKKKNRRRKKREARSREKENDSLQGAVGGAESDHEDEDAKDCILLKSDVGNVVLDRSGFGYLYTLNHRGEYDKVWKIVRIEERADLEAIYEEWLRLLGGFKDPNITFEETKNDGTLLSTVVNFVGKDVIMQCEARNSISPHYFRDIPKHVLHSLKIFVRPPPSNSIEVPVRHLSFVIAPYFKNVWVSSDISCVFFNTEDLGIVYFKNDKNPTSIEDGKNALPLLMESYTSFFFDNKEEIDRLKNTYKGYLENTISDKEKRTFLKNILKHFDEFIEKCREECQCKPSSKVIKNTRRRK